MRLHSSMLRTVTVVLAAVAAPLLLASAAEAAPLRLRSHSRLHHRLNCDSKIAMRRAVARFMRQRPLRIVLRDHTTRIRRSAARSLRTDDVAIQNDALANDVGTDRLRGSLEAIGVLNPRHVPLPVDQRFSPRSPRGPPGLS